MDLCARMAVQDVVDHVAQRRPMKSLKPTRTAWVFVLGGEVARSPVRKTKRARSSGERARAWRVRLRVEVGEVEIATHDIERSQSGEHRESERAVPRLRGVVRVDDAGKVRKRDELVIDDDDLRLDHGGGGAAVQLSSVGGYPWGPVLASDNRVLPAAREDSVLCDALGRGCPDDVGWWDTGPHHPLAPVSANDAGEARRPLGVPCADRRA